VVKVIAAVDDLIRQATEERSHYYVGKVLRDVRGFLLLQDHALILKDLIIEGLELRLPKRLTKVTKVRPPEARRIVEAYTAGKSWNYLELHFKRDRRTIRRVIDRSGVPKRSEKYKKDIF
jgi:hypothetical protein